MDHTRLTSQRVFADQLEADDAALARVRADLRRVAAGLRRLTNVFVKLKGRETALVARLAELKRLAGGTD